MELDSSAAAAAGSRSGGVGSAPMTPRPAAAAEQEDSIKSCPPSQYHSPSMSRSPLLITTAAGDLPCSGGGGASSGSAPNRTPKERSRFTTPLGSPLRKALRMTRLDPQDAWLPITQSRNGNAFYAAFHTLCSGIGFQALILPVSFTILGWAWGMGCLAGAFIWQLYTLYAMVQLHENVDAGVRYSRYMQLATATFGEKWGKLLAAFPIGYLSAGTCTTLIIIGGSTANMLYQTLCGGTTTACASSSNPLTNAEWYLVFTCAALLLSQLPNLNSIAGVSLVGALTAIAYCTLIWAVSVAQGRLPDVSYHPIKRRGGTQLGRVFEILNAVGIIAFAFRGHNLILEIQATMPSSEKQSSRVPMWRGVKLAYLLVALCLFPLAVGGYWAYGQLIPPNGSGMLTALFTFHRHDVSRGVLGLVSICVILNALSSFQIYAMPTFDDMESVYTTKFNRACPWWTRGVLRAVFAFVCYFMAVAIPFLASFAGLIGGIALPVTFSYPCFMWLKAKKPKRYGGMWWLNWVLGFTGVGLSGSVIAASLYIVVDTGVKISFFKP
ncbi:unnamed protein product [Cuscuta campestris]|uniref:Amino acid transporter transmembrane domain-containing protein n=1 Tax=Cuscuta campestris TaxID=132261 RepID=A0A484LPS0_9ASTE|nr:unnamed protein product [Cuscuta campestris]